MALPKIRSEFSRNVLTLLTGTTIAQAIPVGFSPILARLYSPHDFGLFALFFSVVSILGTISTGRYEQAIMLPKKEEDSINLMALCFILIILISIITGLVVGFFNMKIALLLGDADLSFLLYFLPLVVFFIGLYNILCIYSARKKKFKDISKSTVTKSVVSVSVQLVIGFFKSSGTGLITGQVVAQFFSNLGLLRNLKSEKKILHQISKKKMLGLASKYKRFPRFSLPAALTNISSVQLINIGISLVHNASVLGFYAMGQRVLGMPSILLGNSISQVFFQEATKEKLETGKATSTFRSTFKKLLLFAIPLFLILYFTIEELFVFVFGQDWREAGLYAQILIPLFFTRFLSSSLSSVLVIFEKQKMELLINLSLLFFSLIIIFLFEDLFKFLHIYSIVLSINYVVFLVYYYKISS